MSFDPHKEGAKIVSKFDPNSEGATLIDSLPVEQDQNIWNNISNNMSPNIENIKQPSWDDVKNRTKGLAQGAENVGIGYLNFLPGVNISKANWAGESPETKKGELVSDIGSFFLPGGALKAARYIPIIGNALKSAVKGLEHRPILNALAKFGKNTGEGAVSTAALSDKKDQLKEAEKGALLGGGTNIISQLAGLKNPVLNALLRAGIGAGAGVGVNELTGLNHPYQAGAYGAAAGIGLPKVMNIFSHGQPGMETLEHVNPSEIMSPLEASKRLKTPITPAEATGNQYIGGLENQYSQTGGAAAENTKIGLGRYEKQKNAINDLLDTIYDKSSPEATKLSKQRIKELYDKAHRWNLKPEEVYRMKHDPVIESAFKKVQSDPAYRRKLSGVPENNYAYLNQVKRALYDMEKTALRTGEKTRASEFKGARYDLTNIMDKSVPDYKLARQEANKSIIRSNIEKLMSKKQLKGTDFFNTLLKNDNEFDGLYNSLKNVPEAQNKLKDMKLAWKNLINVGKPSASSLKQDKSISDSKKWMTKLMDIWNEMTGDKKNIESLKFIHSGEWDKSFPKIYEMKDYEKRKEALGNLIAKLVTAEQGSEK